MYKKTVQTFDIVQLVICTVQDPAWQVFKRVFETPFQTWVQIQLFCQYRKSIIHLMCLVHREVSLTGFIRAVSICTCSYLQLDCSYTYRCICQRIWEKSRKIIADYDVEVVTQISLPSWCFLSQSRENVSSSLLDVLACSIAVSFFSLFVYPPPPPARAPQNAAQLLNILSKTIFQNHLIRWNNNIRNNDNNEDNNENGFYIIGKN